MNKHQLIEKLALQAHIEGGYFSRTYCSDLKTDTAATSGSRYTLNGQVFGFFRK